MVILHGDRDILFSPWMFTRTSLCPKQQSLSVIPRDIYPSSLHRRQLSVRADGLVVCICSVVVVAFDEKLIVYDACRFRERFTITGRFMASVLLSSFGLAVYMCVGTYLLHVLGRLM